MTFVRQRWTTLHTILAVGAVILGSLVIPVGLKSCAKETLVESQAPLWGALRAVQTLQDAEALKLQSKDELIKIIRELAETQAGLELKLKTFDAVEDSRGRLEQLLKMPSPPGYETKAARVLSRDVNAWWQTVLIDIGRAQGVRPGLGVVSRFGVVGRVREAAEQTSVVELITSPHFRMAAQLKGDARPFVFEGMGLRLGMAPAGLVQALQPEMTLKENQTRVIVTTGLSGSFPEGVPMGELVETRGVSEGGLLQGKAKLPEELLSLKEVSVLVPYR